MFLQSAEYKMSDLQTNESSDFVKNHKLLFPFLVAGIDDDDGDELLCMISKFRPFQSCSQRVTVTFD